MVELILIALFALAVVVGAIFGLARGLNKSVIRLITVVLAVVLTFLIAGPVTTTLTETIKVEGKTLGELILESLQDSKKMGAIVNTVPVMREVVLVLPAFAVSLVVFPVVFFVLKFITWIAFLLIQKPLRKLIFKDNCNKEEDAQQPKGVRAGKRFAGMGVGIVTGMLIFGMLAAPVLGLFSTLPPSDTVDSMLDTMVQQNILSASDAAAIKECYAVTDSGVAKFYNLVGIAPAGRLYLNSVSTVKADGRTIRLASELKALLGTMQIALDGGVMSALLNAKDQNALYALLADKAFMSTLMQDMFHSNLLSSVMPEVMAFAMESVATTMNVPADKGIVYDNMMDNIAQTVQSADIDYAGIKAYEDAHGITSTLELLSNTTKKAKKLMTEKQYKAELQKLADLAKSISSILDTAVAGDNTAFNCSVANHIVNQVKTKVSKNGQAALESFNAASVQESIAAINAADIDASVGEVDKLLEKITTKELFETKVATVETIKESVKESVHTALADEKKVTETANTLAGVVSDLASAVSSATGEDGKMDVSKLDFDKVASAVTNLQDSHLKDIGSSVLDIVASGDLGKNDMVGGIIDAVKDGYDKGEDVGGAIGTAGALAGLGSALGSEDEKDQEVVVNSVASLVNNLNDFTISLLPTVLSTDTLTSMGITEEYVDSAYGVIETLLKELAKLKGAADYKAEADAILSLYNLVSSDQSLFTEDTMVDLLNSAIKSDAIFNTLVSVSTSNPFGIKITDKNARADIADAIEDFYGKSGKTDRERDVCNAISTLLGIEDAVKLK